MLKIAKVANFAITVTGDHGASGQNPSLAPPPYIRYIPRMTAPHDSRTFKSGNSVAVRLHRALGLPEGVDVTTETLGGGVWIRPKVKRPSLAEMAATLLAMGPVGEIEQRLVDLPERAGL